LEGKPHKIEFWDSRLSGKKKISLDDNEIKSQKEVNYFYYQFKIGEYTFSLHHFDTNTDLLINNKNYTELMKEERSGILDNEKKNYLRKNNNKNEINNDYALSGENIYDIKEQKRLLEEFERKKKREKEKIKNFYIGNEQNNSFKNTNKYNQFVLDDKTVNKNRLIICNIQNIFDDDNEEDEFNMNDFTWDNTTYNLNKINDSANKNNIPYYQENKFEMNSNINLNQININANNQHNQDVINQFFDFTQNKTNNNIDSKYPNMDNINNFNGNKNIQNNNKYDDDFNPFLD